MPGSSVKVLVVCSSLGQGGAERVAATLLSELPRDRFVLAVALQRLEGEHLATVPSDVTIHPLGNARIPWAWLPLARVIRREAPDVVFSLGGMNLVIGLARAVSRRRPRVVLSERNTLDRVAQAWKHRLMTALKRLLYKRADRVTAVSTGLGQELIDRLGLAANKVVVVHNPVGTSSIPELAAETVHHEWFETDTPLVLAVGRLVPQKDYPTLLKAFSKVRRARDARLVILGEGPLERQLRALADNLGIGSDVWFGGFDINPFRYMARCSCFVLSSRHEGLPGALIQAMACGAPVVSTDCPYGPSEIIVHGESGFLCPVGDVDAIIEHIERFLADPVLRARMGVKAREAVSAFTADRIIEQYASVLTSVTRPAERRGLKRIKPRRSGAVS